MVKMTAVNAAYNPHLPITVAPKVLKNNPVKGLHAKLYGKAMKEEETEKIMSVFFFRIRVHFDLLMELPVCYAVNSNRPTTCKCMRDPKPTNAQQIESTRYLLGFARLTKEQQRSLVCQWIKYASSLKGDLLGQRRADQLRVFLMPGTTHQICSSALQRLIGYGYRSWITVNKFAVTNETPKHGLAGKTGAESNRAVDGAAMQSFFTRMCLLGGPRATRQVRMLTGELELRDKDEELIELPPFLTKLGLYKRFVAEAGWTIEYDAKKRIKGKRPIEGMEQLEDVPSETTFMNYWYKNFPHLVAQRAREDICGDCYTFANRHKYISNLLAGETEEAKDDDSTSGGRKNSRAKDKDEEAVTANAVDDERALLVEKQENEVMKAAHHVKMAKAQREHFRDKKEEAFLDRQQGKPMEERSLCFVADYAQNLSVPNFAGEQPGDTYYYSPANAFCFGVADCSTRPTKLNAYTYLEDVGKKGGNNVASMLMMEFQSHGLIPTPATIATHKPVKEINLFFDNCGGQNKNKMIIRLLTFMVKWKLCKRARAIFLIRGHTKNDCDRIFNLMKMVYRKKNVYTPDEMIEAIGTATDVTPVEVTGFKDWSSLQDKYMTVPKSGSVNINHIFSVDAADPNKLFTQEYIDADQKEQVIVLPAYRDDYSSWLALEEPQSIPAAGIQYIKWAELFDKWKKFIPLDRRSKWKYYNEDMPADKRAALKGHTADSKKKRKTRERVLAAVAKTEDETKTGRI